MGRSSGGTTCPKCHQYAPIRKDGTMGVHRTEFYVWGQRAGGQVRERCAFVGVTPGEAAQGITVHKKRLAEYEAAGGMEGLRARLAATGRGSIPRGGP